jgi:hypothetical protein
LQESWLGDIQALTQWGGGGGATGIRVGGGGRCRRRYRGGGAGFNEGKLFPSGFSLIDSIAFAFDWNFCPYGFHITVVVLLFFLSYEEAFHPLGNPNDLARRNGSSMLSLITFSRFWVAVRIWAAFPFAAMISSMQLLITAAIVEKCDWIFRF